MTLRIVIDMNLSPEWASLFADSGHHAVHWSSVGDPRAEDSVIMEWARDNNHVILTHDLDFGTALALTHEHGPSVVQVRTSNPLPEHVFPYVLDILTKYAPDLLSGALIVLNERTARVRILPL